jgi:hypothetical protein
VKLFDSNDPALNATMFIMACAVGLVLVGMGLAFALPVLTVIGIAKGIHWYYTRPVRTDILAEQTQTLIERAGFPNLDTFIDDFTTRLTQHYADNPPIYSIFHKMIMTAGLLYEDEKLGNTLAPLPPANTIEEGKYRDRLLAQTKKIADPAKTLDLFTQTLSESLASLPLPPMAHGRASPDTTHPYTIPLIDLLPNIGQAINEMLDPFCATEVANLDLFHTLRQQFTQNIIATKKGKEFVAPDQHKGTPREIIHTYLANTPFEHIFDAQVPFDFDEKSRMEHFHLCAGSGSGKTQFIQNLILHDLQKEDPPALIIIDSQQDMLDKIQRLALFNEKLADRLVIIDPIYTPALNMFTSSDRLGTYSRDNREQVEASIIELYNYIFGAIASELTSKQNVAFSFVVRLMLAMPSATIHTLRELMEDKSAQRWTPHIERLDLTAQAFFKNQFFDKSFSQTRQQIARRLYSVLSVPSFDRMFSTTENKLDMFECIQSKKIVLVNTSKALLKTDACALFGRYMIAQTMAAAFERAATQHRPPAFLIIDEAADYFDDTLENLLAQARKYSLGVLIAHQAMSQMSTSLQNIVAGNTSIKMAGGISDKDARALAPDMRTTTEQLTNLKKTDRSAQFMAYIRNKTGQAVIIDVPFGILEAQPKMTNDEHAQLIERNRERYSATQNAPSGSDEASHEFVSEPHPPIIHPPKKNSNPDEDTILPSTDY